MGNSLVVLWLGFCAFTAEGPDSIPSWGTKIPRAALCGQKKKKRKRKKERDCHRALEREIKIAE